MPYLHSADPHLELEALKAVVTPVLTAHGVGLVELLFRRERPGWVLRLTVENPVGPEPGEGVTLDRCADISRDLSAALDVADLIRPAYTLEVGSPGLERPLYDEADYRRFAGQKAKLVLRQPLASGPLSGQSALVGALGGVEGEGANAQVLIEVTAQRGAVHAERVGLGVIKNGHLVYDPAASVARGRGAAAQGKGVKLPRRAGPGKTSE